MELGKVIVVSMQVELATYSITKTTVSVPKHSTHPGHWWCGLCASQVDGR